MGFNDIRTGEIVDFSKVQIQHEPAEQQERRKTMTIGPEPSCTTCKHFSIREGKLRCEAFPKGIPDAIFLGGVDHKKPYKGDNGIQYEKRIIPKEIRDRFRDEA